VALAARLGGRRLAQSARLGRPDHLAPAVAHPLGADLSEQGRHEHRIASARYTLQRLYRRLPWLLFTCRLL
jgi:hypothetical protein